MLSLSRTRGVSWIVSLLLAAWGTSAHAAGLGSIAVQSSLGQPLRAAVSLLGTSDNDPDVHCLAARVTSTDGSISIPAQVKLVRSAGATTIQISTLKGINELALDISVALGCDISVQRTYQVLIDPAVVLPTVEESRKTISSAESDGEIPLPATASNGNTSGDSAPKRHASSGTRARHHETTSAAIEAVDTPEQKKEKPRHKESRHASHNVLKMSGLDAPMDDFLSESGLKMSDQLAGGAETDPQKLAEIKQAQSRFAAYLRGEDPAQTAADRLKAAQAEVEKLSAEVARNNVRRQSDMAALQSTQTESHRWIRGLQIMLGVCLAVLAWLMWRFYAVRRNETYTSWRDLLGDHQGSGVNTDSRLGENSGFNTSTFGSFDTNTSTFGTGAFQPTNSEFNTFDPNTTGNPVTATPSNEEHRSRREPAASAESHKTMRGAPLSQKPTTDAEDGKPAPVKYHSNSRIPYTRHQQTDTRNHNPEHYLKVEEISDVMELANVWMALHDPQKVIDLLEPFSGVEQPESPLPWLCLLDVYRSVGDRAKYEAILERIKKLYNVKLEPWHPETDAEPPKTLADFPHIVDIVLKLWESDDIVHYLDKLMKDDREGTRQGFDLPVYRDIIRLLTLANETTNARKREDAEREIADAISAASLKRQAAIDAAPRDKPETTQKAAAPETPAAERKPVLRERPKYITTSYQRNLRTRSDAPLAEKKPDFTPAVADGTESKAAQDSSVAIEDTGETTADVQPAPAEMSEYDSMSPMAIKLHLATAYVDIGDKEGALLLLEEVIQDGNAEQIEQAKSLLATIN